ncbi:hypothetical protein V9T40_009007 [Parthenolecanium corni]|uniref:CXXC-type domain-containing protein n=1 Tax=Parthenolecanium corni TaxID=536013 RepID=A0AAN9Y746_9HEMI
MSEGGGEALGPTFVAPGSFQSPQPPTPSSTVPDAGGGADPNSKSTSSSSLPPFSTFTVAESVSEGLGLRLGPDAFGQEPYSRFEFHTYNEEGLPTRLLERPDNIHLLIPQPQYRPWESKPMDSTTITTPDGYPAKMYEYSSSQIPSKLPSLGTQFSVFPVDANGIGSDTISLTTLTPASLSPPNNSSSLPGFPVINRSYPLVPVPTPPVQFLDDRSMQLFPSPTLSNVQYQQLGSSGITQGNFVTHSQPSHKATLVTVVNQEPGIPFVTPPQPIYHIQNHGMLEHETSIKAEDSSVSPSPRNVLDSRKKERRKPRTSSTPLEAAIESDGVGSSSVESSGQVAAISSTANFNKRSLMQQQGMGPMGANVSAGNGPPGSGEECENGPGEKQTKKKRKRCGECIGCKLKDNCNNCAPCRNDKSHQICKMRRCEKLTDKKVSVVSAYGFGL